MGSLNPVGMLGIYQQGLGLVDALVKSESSYKQNVRSEDVALEQLQAQQALQHQQNMQNVALEKRQIAAQSEVNEQNRRAALKRAVARQRAQFGGSGIAQGSGSSEAVLLGMFEETEGELAQREQLDNLRKGALDQRLAQSNSLNVLQYEQLRQRQDLNNAASNYDRYKTMVDVGIGAADMAERWYEDMTGQRIGD